MVWIAGQVFLLLIAQYYWGRKDVSTSNYSSYNEGVRLQRELAKISSGGLESIPQYKFYTEIIEEVLRFNQIYGVPLQGIVKLIRRHLSQDLAAQRLVEQHLWGGLIQLFFIILLTWIMSVVSYYLVAFEMSVKIKLVVIVLQVLAPISFFIFFKLIQKKTFAAFSNVYECFIRFKCLMSVGLESSEVFDYAKLEVLEKIQDSELNDLASHLLESARDWKLTGRPILEELEVLQGEISFLNELLNNRFKKQIELLKFLVLCLFGMSSYALMLSGIFSSNLFI